MTSIEYTYKIIAVDEAARCMEVVYSAEGHQTMHIGARLPFEGEALEDVIKMFAPVPLWIEQSTPVVAPAVGAAGVISTASTELETPQTPQVAERPYTNQELKSIFPTLASGEIGMTILT
jgi:hypothetical protein